MTARLTVPGSLACPVCSTKDCQFFQSKGSWAHARCSVCGTVFVISPPSEAELIELYQKTAGYSVPVHSGIELFSEIIRRGLDALDSMSPRVLDVGCASGNFLAQFPDDCELFGCDINESDVALAKSRGLVDVYVGTLQDCDFPLETFDWVHLGDVLEHVVDPVGLLRDAVHLVKPGGLITIGTPDMESSWAKFSFGADRVIGGGSSVLSPPYHLVNFSRRALLSMGAGLGLEAIASWSRPPSLSYEVQSSFQLRRDQKLALRQWLRLGWIQAVYTFGFLISWLRRRILFSRNHDLHLTIFFRKTLGV